MPSTYHSEGLDRALSRNHRPGPRPLPLRLSRVWSPQRAFREASTCSNALAARKIPASGAPDVPAGVQNTVGDWDIWTFWHWTRHARTQSSGPALLAPLGYMCVDGQRFWSEALRSNPHRDMLVGGREEWQKVEGLFA